MSIEEFRKNNHYYWLEENFPAFLQKLGINFRETCPGIISSHGDKGSFYREEWEKKGIHFFHGMALFLLTYLRPYENECRETKNGWVAPGKWVIENYSKFKEYLPEIKK